MMPSDGNSGNAWRDHFISIVICSEFCEKFACSAALEQSEEASQLRACGEGVRLARSLLVRRSREYWPASYGPRWSLADMRSRRCCAIVCPLQAKSHPPEYPIIE